MKAEEGWRCEGDAAPGPYSTSTARMLLPGTLGNSRSKTIDTFDAGAFISCAVTFVDSREAPASSSKVLFFMVALLLMRSSAVKRVPNRQSVSVQQCIGPRGQGRLCRGPLRSTSHGDRE